MTDEPPDRSQQHTPAGKIPWWLRWKLIIGIGVVVLLSTVGLKSTWNALHLALPLSSPDGSLTAQKNQQVTGDPQWHLATRASIANAEYTWVFDTGEPLTVSPSVSEGEIFLISGTKTSTGRVQALNASSGDLIWEVPLNTIADHPPTVAGGSVFVGTRRGAVLNLDRETGLLEWSFDGLASISGPPVVVDGVLYAGASSVYALDVATGKVRWRHKVGDRVVWPLAVDDGIVAALASDSHFYLLDAYNGTRLLTFPFWFKPIGGPVISDQTVVFSGANGNVQAMALHGTDIPFEKALRWWKTKFYLWDIRSSPPPVPRGYLWQQRQLGGEAAHLVGGDSQRVYLTIDDPEAGGRVVALDGLTGELVWEVGSDSRFAAGATLLGSVVIVGTEEGKVYGIDAGSGRILWEILVEGPVSAAPAVMSELLLVPSSNGKLYAVDVSRTFGLR